MPNTVILKGDPLYKEGVASEAGITPGELLDLGSGSNVARHAAAGQNAQARFAIEDRDIGGDIDTDYANGGRVHYVAARPGDEIYAWLAASQTIARGDELESNGDGAFRAHTPQAVNEGGAATYTIYVNAVVAVAAEAVTTAGAAARIRVEVV